MPPPAYWKALRAISETAVAIRVWSWRVEAQQAGDLARPLPGGHHVLLLADLQSEMSGSVMTGPPRAGDHDRHVVAAAGKSR